jgi:GalNAc-alpha-(1->4)-GalNAc-alpha-(1->3)-diNAcBac-PP-undecaprenol alpha-1,4-N-acetyl-D-galactosaminyltransferase
VRRLVLFISSLAAGGAERSLSQLANHWVEQGVEVELVTWASANEPDFFYLSPKVKRTILSQPGRAKGLVDKVVRGFRIVWCMRQLIRKIAPDAVLSFMDITNIMVLVAAVGTGARVVVAERTDPSMSDTPSRPWRLARRLLYRWAHTVAVQTIPVADWVKNQCGTHRVAVIPNFIRPLPEPRGDRQKWVVSVGRLFAYKGFEHGIRAFAATGKHLGGWEYILLGDGPQREELQTLARELGVAQFVRFPGMVNQVEEWLVSASICMQPSRFEGFPNAVLEAMAMGVATISTDCRSGPSDMITHGVDGLLVPVGDLPALTLELDCLMTDDNRRAELGRAGMSVRQRFDPDAVIAQWNNVLFDQSSH